MVLLGGGAGAAAGGSPLLLALTLGVLGSGSRSSTGASVLMWAVTGGAGVLMCGVSLSTHSTACISSPNRSGAAGPEASFASQLGIPAALSSG